MTKFLMRIFLKNLDPEKDRSAVGQRSGFVGIVCNLALFAGKLLAGTLAGSVSIMADAMNNLTDASSSAVTFWGFRMAQRPADAHHPYGHARYEYVSGFVVATLILAIGLELAKSSIERIISPAAMEFSSAAMIVMLAAIAL